GRLRRPRPSAGILYEDDGTHLKPFQPKGKLKPYAHEIDPQNRSTHRLGIAQSAHGCSHSGKSETVFE
ncbi:MAG TPA: hypothetical protein PK078_02060, partial [Anaerolineales bacterium]|nr:hypothetical protein [Anaerolineales bacterium]